VLTSLIDLVNYGLKHRTASTLLPEKQSSHAQSIRYHMRRPICLMRGRQPLFSEPLPMDLLIHVPTEALRSELRKEHAVSACVPKAPLRVMLLIVLQLVEEEVVAGSGEMCWAQELAEVVSYPVSKLGSYHNVKSSEWLGITFAAPVFPLCPSELRGQVYDPRISGSIFQ
jgi:hypothetical protein